MRYFTLHVSAHEQVMSFVICRGKGEGPNQLLKFNYRRADSFEDLLSVAIEVATEVAALEGAEIVSLSHSISEWSVVVLFKTNKS